MFITDDSSISNSQCLKKKDDNKRQMHLMSAVDQQSFNFKVDLKFVLSGTELSRRVFYSLTQQFAPSYVNFAHLGGIVWHVMLGNCHQGVY